MLLSENQTVLSSRVSQVLSDRRSRASSCNSFKSGDEEDEDLQAVLKLNLDKKGKNNKDLYEIVNAFEANFFESIHKELLRQGLLGNNGNKQENYTRRKKGKRSNRQREDKEKLVAEVEIEYNALKSK